MGAETVRNAAAGADGAVAEEPVVVSAGRIARFADAIGDPHPAYRSAAAARVLGHPDVIAPPTFAVRLAARAEARLLGDDHAVLQHLSQEVRHTRPVRAGDVLVARARLLSLRHALGGVLLTLETTVSAPDGTVVAVCRSRLLSRDTAPAGPDPDTIRAALEELVGREDFSCLGAKAALRRGTVRHRHHGELGSDTGVLSHLDDLYDFLETFEPTARSYTSHVATFDPLPDTSERTFEETVWRHLQRMHDEDARHHVWSDAYDADPASPRFAFCVGGHPFFVVGLHPGASRPGRRFTSPALVFNSHLQFNAMGPTFFKLRRKIRQRERAFHGSVNPSLATYRDEARHYGGRMTEPDWRCPFAPHPATGPDDPGRAASAP
ncbi:guanitoxin biosynthesis heme-dependent pre-guanitoxin N-hydroxylase GntA [Streptomyces sp. NPDC026672]|uniref:guanitoxin biosynthesis heme-dependent pre-guanitoxin N-hydroxylase GntA n=1 Tax=unclassified Streptomyces TaxID=2593676 RepID=UPI0033FB1990